MLEIFSIEKYGHLLCSNVELPPNIVKERSYDRTCYYVYSYPTLLENLNTLYPFISLLDTGLLVYAYNRISDKYYSEAEAKKICEEKGLVFLGKGIVHALLGKK